jgi:hypothetical protein
MVALVNTNGDEFLTFCNLFKTIFRDQALVSPKNGAS